MELFLNSGFLSTGDDTCAGNFGIQDQLAALKWVSNNIKFFGGNPHNITIFGHDSGAISASILLIYAESWGLYHNVILSGGSVFTPNAVKLPDPKMAEDFGRAVNCDVSSLLEPNNQNSSQKLMECLRTKSVEELMSGTRLSGLYPNTFQFTFGPVINKNVTLPVIIDEPIRLFRSGNYWKTPLISGITLNEGSLDFFTYYDKIKDWTLSEKIDYLFSRFSYNEFYSKLIIKSVDWFYFKRLNDTFFSYTSDNRKYFQNNNIFNQNKDWINRQKEEQILIEVSLQIFSFN